jgi:hypothetical protein
LQIEASVRLIATVMARTLLICDGKRRVRRARSL